jgi:hypothetical protein
VRQERFGSSLKHGARDSRQAAALGTGGAVMFGGNASERCGRSGSYSAVHNGPFTIDVVLELNNHELLIADYAFDKIAD